MSNTPPVPPVKTPSRLGATSGDGDNSGSGKGSPSSGAPSRDDSGKSLSRQSTSPKLSSVLSLGEKAVKKSIKLGSKAAKLGSKTLTAGTSAALNAESSVASLGNQLKSMDTQKFIKGAMSSAQVNLASGVFGEYVPACGVEKEIYFDNREIKGVEYKRVLNLESTKIPNYWGPKAGWLFFPKSDFINLWDSLLALLVIYVAIMEPIRVGFTLETDRTSEVFGGLYWFELVVDILFICDLFVCLRTCFIIRDEWQNQYLIQDPVEIRNVYFRSWFFLDLIAVFPMAYILEIYEESTPGDNLDANDKNILKFVLRLVRLTKLIRLRRISDLMERLEHTFPRLFESYVLIKMFFSITYCAHVIACLWYLCGTTAGDLGWVAGVADTTDITSVPRMYLISFYWSFTTMTTVGFGDITGSTGIEQGFSIFAMGIGGFTFALIVGSIGDLITRDGVAETAYLQMMGELKEFLASKSVPKELSMRVIRFHERLYSNRTVFDEQKIFERLPELLRSEVVLHMYGAVLRRVPLFATLTDRTLADVCLELKAYHATAGEAFTVEGDRADKMFVIKSGMVKLSVQGDELLSSPMKGGDFFGVICLAGLSDIRPYTTTAMRQCQLCTLSRDDMEMLVGMHPEMGDLLMDFARVRLAEIKADVEASRNKSMRDRGEISDTQTELASMSQITSTETKKEGVEMQEKKKSAQEVFQRIHLARFVAAKHSPAKKRWGKIMKGGRMFSAIADAAEKKEGEKEAAAEPEAPSVDDLLGASGDGTDGKKFNKSLSEVTRVVRKTVAVDPAEVEPTIEEIPTDPVLALVQQLAKKMETQDTVLTKMSDRMDSLLEKQNSVMRNVVSYRGR